MLKKINSRVFTGDIAILIYIGLASTVCHLLVGGNYGYFLDELYTMACSRHLSLAFVDIPPVAPALLALNTGVFGDSLFALHILPSVFSGATVIITGLMAKELGGKRLAVVMAGLCAAFVPVWMALGSLYTYDFLDQLMIISLFYAVIRLIKRENLKTWLAIGAIAGLGVMTKPSMVFFILGIAIALLCTKHRRQYLTRWPWLGALVALLIILPALVWQLQNHFPIAQYWTGYTKDQAVHVNPLEFLLMQVVIANVILLPVWGAGLASFLFGKQGKQFRLLGVISAVLFVLFMLTGAKPYMPAPLYAMLIAGGSVAIERFAAGGKWKRALIPVYAGVIVLTGVIQAPNFMPILQPDTLSNYYNVVGGAFGMKTVKLGANVQNDVMPQYFYDRFEWDVLVRDVAEIYHSIPEPERADTAIVTQNYGYAGAVDELGGALGLPKSMCGQLNYYYFSLGDIGKKTWIMIGESQADLEQVFGSVTLARVSRTKIRLPHELNIFVCRQPKFTAEQAIEGIKNFN